LQTWNKAYYRYRRKFDNAHFESIEGLLSRNRALLARYRETTIDQLGQQERTSIIALFCDFERVLGPVGAAKALHLLAPGLFPLWDRAIAGAYDLPLGAAGSNGERYWRFLLIAQHQCLGLKRDDPNCPNPLKAIDEYNYCRHTKKWAV
jgi:hypothetical protein